MILLDNILESTRARTQMKLFSTISRNTGLNRGGSQQSSSMNF